MIDRDEVYQIYDAILKGEMNKEEAAEWAYDAIGKQEGFADNQVEDALYKLVSFHSVGMMFNEYRPNDGQMMEIRERLTGEKVAIEDEVISNDSFSDFIV